MANIRWKRAGDDGAQLAMFGTARREVGRGEYRGLEFFEVETKRLITKQPGGPRYGFEYSINAYRGCSHRCGYCFARPTHEYLGFDGGVDFDTKIVVKINAVERARHELAPARWGGDLVAMGTNTDPYQPAEGKYRLTRGIVEVMADYGNPTAILTKSPLVLRDLDVLRGLGDRCRVDFSVGTLDEEVWKLTEPGAPHPRKRLDALATIREAGIEGGVLMGPIIPGMSDHPEQIRQVVDAAADAGATSIGGVPLHLRGTVADHFYRRIAPQRPELVPRYRRHFSERGEAPREYQDRIRETIAAAKKGKIPDRGPSPSSPGRRPATAAAETQLALPL